MICCGLTLIVGLVNVCSTFSSLFSAESSSSVVDGVTAIDGICVGIECLRIISENLRGLCDDDIDGGCTGDSRNGM